MRPEFDPDEMRRRDEARIVMLRVGLALIDDARRGGGFETDERKLTARVEAILASLHAAGTNPGRVIVEATPQDPEHVRLSTPTRHGSSVAVLRADGVLLEQGTTMGVGLATVEVDELSPKEQEEMEAAQAEWLEQVQREVFQGKRFLRALPLDPQPGAEVQLLAAELFDDGIVVHYTLEQTQDEFEARCVVEEAEMLREGSWDPTGLGLRIEDDLGTAYRASGGGGGSAGVIRRSASFTPAVPDAARTLLISVGAHTVEVRL